MVGCTHGQLDTIYKKIKDIELSSNTKVSLVSLAFTMQVDLLLCCGDFEAVRNQHDLDCLSGPKKYHMFKDFYKVWKK